MVPLVLLTVDIVPLDQTMGEEELRELSVPCLNHLKELRVALTATTTYSSASVSTHKKMDTAN